MRKHGLLERSRKREEIKNLYVIAVKGRKSRDLSQLRAVSTCGSIHLTNEAHRPTYTHTHKNSIIHGLIHFRCKPVTGTTTLMEKKCVKRQSIHFVLVDLEKADDSVPLKKLWEVLKNKVENKLLVNAIGKLCENATSRIKIGKNVSEEFLVTKGLRQGCSLSPTLFKIYIQQALQNWKKKFKDVGIPTENSTIYTLSFGDDQLIIAQDYEDKEYMTRKLIEEYNKWDLKINLEKTLYNMSCGEEMKDLVLEVGMGCMKGCEECEYLGILEWIPPRRKEGKTKENLDGRYKKWNEGERGLEERDWETREGWRKKIRI
ncbi:hypothetical protein ANN_01385 [Periplaneta americana]|uniref:Reverse transcriptase domain-containing protein n=1 Tax=Periplaneta americana TaxID=6978 RepID=A0ABQ8TUH6_PERAM|nr:hypothetical protein ANN_01385 [Periplaneta americana]